MDPTKFNSETTNLNNQEDFHYNTPKNSFIDINKNIFKSLKLFSNYSIFQKEILFYLVKISDDKEIQYLKNSFEELDLDKNGMIEIDELIMIYDKVGMEKNKVKLFFN